MRKGKMGKGEMGIDGIGKKRDKEKKRPDGVKR